MATNVASTLQSPWNRAQSFCQIPEKWKPKLALLPQKTPEEVYQERYQAAVVLYDNALDLASSNKVEQVDPAPWKARRTLVFDCELRLRRLEEQREETREEDEGVYKRSFEDFEDACAFDLFDLLGRSRVEDIVRKWCERDAERSSPAQTNTLIAEASSRPDTTSQPSASTGKNTTPQETAASQPYITPPQAAPSGPVTATRQSVSSQTNATPRLESSPRPVAPLQQGPSSSLTIPTRSDVCLRPNTAVQPRAPLHIGPRTTEPATISHFAPRPEPNHRVSCQENPTSQATTIEPGPHRLEAQNNKTVANGAQSARLVQPPRPTKATQPTQATQPTPSTQPALSTQSTLSTLSGQTMSSQKGPNIQENSNGQQKR
ncbi:hypothetical protein FGRMN_10008, partial [Fusarium graminum]